jgi:cardiolipin synthase
MNKVLTVPNLITLTRSFLLCPIYNSLINCTYLITIIYFTIFCLMDLFDGFIARKYNQISNAGTLLDPFVDKMATSLIFFYFFNINVISSYFFYIILCKEIILIIMAFLLWRKKVSLIKAENAGKLAMGATSLYIISILLYGKIHYFFEIMIIFFHLKALLIYGKIYLKKVKSINSLNN